MHAPRRQTARSNVDTQANAHRRETQSDVVASDIDERKAQLRRQIAETMERVRRLTTDQGTSRLSARSEGESKSTRRRSTLSSVTDGSPAICSTTSPVRGSPQYDPESPFESGRSISALSVARRARTPRSFKASPDLITRRRKTEEQTSILVDGSRMKDDMQHDHQDVKLSYHTIHPSPNVQAHKAGERQGGVKILSPETSRALASLEATLARLELGSPTQEKGTKGGRRSLSPSKELIKRREARRAQTQGAQPREFKSDSPEQQQHRRILSDPKGIATRHTGSAGHRWKRISHDQGVQTTSSTPRIDKGMQYLSSNDGENPSTSPTLRSSVDVLCNVCVLVDVRAQDGTDQSEVWVNMLQDLGASVLTKIPGDTKEEAGGGRSLNSIINYILFKNGKPSTLRYHRSVLDAGREPPLIVSVKWAQECEQRRSHLDGRDYLVEVGRQSGSLIAKRKAADRGHLPSSSPVKVADARPVDLAARRKLTQYAPVRPSPLANRCWNLDVSTSSSSTTATHTTTTVDPISR